MRMKKDKGIVLFAFGKKGYVFMAHNMALSILKHSPNIDVTLYVEADLKHYIYDASIYTEVKELNQSDIYASGVGLEPAKLKTNLYKYLPYKHNLYLDVDGVLLKDIEPLLDACIDGEYSFNTDVIGKGKINEQIDYNIWADNQKIFEFFDLKETDVLPAIQSSWAYIRKDKVAENFYKEAKKYYEKGFKVTDLKRRWGGKLPDELIISGVMAKLQYIPEAQYLPVFYGNRIVSESYKDITSKHYVLSIYGNGNGRTLTQKKYFDWYDALARSYGMELNKQHYDSRKFLHDKFANGK